MHNMMIYCIIYNYNHQLEVMVYTSFCLPLCHFSLNASYSIMASLNGLIDALSFSGLVLRARELRIMCERHESRKSRRKTCCAVSGGRRRA